MPSARLASPVTVHSIRKKLPLDPSVLAGELAELGELSETEEEVVRLVLLGQTTEQIGIRLGRKPRTVKYWRSNAFEKLGVASTGELWGLLFEYAGHGLEPS